MDEQKKQEIFRKVALERAASPDRLDQLVEIISAPAWITAASFLALVGGAIAWSWFGTIPSRVSGGGIVIREGGVRSVVAVAAGQVGSIAVEAGDPVAKGQVIATLAQPALEEEIEKARAHIAELRRQQVTITALGDQTKRAQRESLARERQAARAALASARQRTTWLKQAIVTEQAMFKKGLTTNSSVMAAKRDYESNAEAIAREMSALQQIEAREADLRSRAGQESLSGSLKISERERELELLEERLAVSSVVASPFHGRVVEVRAQEGSLVAPGDPIVNLELVRTSTIELPLQALVYVPPAAGKKVRPGMRAEISPSTVRQEEYGVLLGEVLRTSKFPATRQGMVRVLGNDELVGEFLAQSGGAPIAVEIALLRDPTTVSGYAWSSGQGPPIDIDSGTPVLARITLKEQRPLDLIFP